MAAAVSEPCGNGACGGAQTRTLCTSGAACTRCTSRPLVASAPRLRLSVSLSPRLSVPPSLRPSFSQGVRSARRAAPGRRRRRHTRARDGRREHRMGGSAGWTAQCTAWVCGAVFSARCTMHDTRRTVHGVRCAVCGVRGAVYDARRTLCTVYGCTVYCVLCTVYCVLCTAPHVSGGGVVATSSPRHLVFVSSSLCLLVSSPLRLFVPPSLRCQQRKTNRTRAAQTTTRARARRAPRAPHGRERETDSAVYGARVRCGVQFTVYDARRTVYSIRCTVYGVR